MNIAITKLSSKGQIVIPQDMREKLNVGDKLVIMESDDSIILKKMDKFSKKFQEDLEFARRSEAILEEYEKHPEKFISKDFDEFIEELKKW